MQAEAAATDRIFHIRGRNAYDLGVNLGRLIGPRLTESIQQHFAARLPEKPKLSGDRSFQEAAMKFMNRLPDRFRDELQGLSMGARVPLERLAEWIYLEPYLESGCTGAVCLFDGRAWVARNNDFFAPHLWGYATIRELSNRIPTITFSLLGDVFTPTGINRDRLWLHYNYLDTWDQPTPGRQCLPPYAFMVEALETCSALQDLEKLLNQVDRNGGMLLFAVDGKTNDFALYECTCRSHLKLEPSESWLVGANHFTEWKDPQQDPNEISGSVARQKRMQELVQDLYNLQETPSLPVSLIQALADDGIERRDGNPVTVYANVACPSTGEIWYTFGGYPAASNGNWAKLTWPW
jgi:hypothetical protein